MNNRHKPFSKINFTECVINIINRIPRLTFSLFHDATITNKLRLDANLNSFPTIDRI